MHQIIFEFKMSWLFLSIPFKKEIENLVKFSFPSTELAGATPLLLVFKTNTLPHLGMTRGHLFLSDTLYIAIRYSPLLLFYGFRELLD